MKKAAFWVCLFICLFFIKANAQYSVLLNFNDTNGASPEGSLILSGGILYGMTNEGGANNDGDIFSVHTDGSGFKTLLNFNGTNGANPYGELILSNGVLYGMTENGGANNDGCIFSMDSNGNGFKVLFDFNGTNGANPLRSLIISGKTLYGLASEGGAHNVGCVFSIDTNGNEYRDLFDFVAIDGGLPYGSLTLLNGKFYGTTSGGGANGVGCIFSLYFTAPIKIEVGRTLETGEKIYINANSTKHYNNFHIAVAGNSGTGKTQFALELLSQYSTQSNGQVNFIYLDFKGLKKGEESNALYKPFFEKTKTTYINAPQVPFPLNPLSFIDNINEMNKKMGISKFVDIIAKYSNIGKKQEQTLKDATRDAFEEKKSGDYPSLKNIYEKVVERMKDKRDTLTEILDSLSDYTIFDSKPKVNFLSKNYYLSLSGDLPDAVRFTSVFLVINYIYNTFMNMENTPTENGCQGMRYILLIDEAHVIFKEKKSQDLLEKILREIRSKGVSIVLLSQGIEEFNQPSFDFSSMCEISFLLDIKDKNNSRMINKFLGFSDKESARVARAMEEIKKGQAISNIKEFSKGELFTLSQFKK